MASSLKLVTTEHGQKPNWEVNYWSILWFFFRSKCFCALLSLYRTNPRICCRHFHFHILYMKIYLCSILQQKLIAYIYMPIVIDMKNYKHQKCHFGLTSSSFSVNSLYWYHSAPDLPTGNGGLTNISTGFGTCTAKCSSPAVASVLESELVDDLQRGSTVIHPKPDMATSQAGLREQRREETFILADQNNHAWIRHLHGTKIK